MYRALLVASLVLVSCLAVRPVPGDEFDDFFALDDDGGNEGISLEWKARLTDFTYADSHPESEIDNMKDLRIQLDASWPVGRFLLFGSGEGSLRYSVPKRDDEFVAAQPAAELEAARRAYGALETRLGTGRPTRAAACADSEIALSEDLHGRIDRLGGQLSGYRTF